MHIVGGIRNGGKMQAFGRNAELKLNKKERLKGGKYERIHIRGIRIFYRISLRENQRENARKNLYEF